MSDADPGAAAVKGAPSMEVQVQVPEAAAKAVLCAVLIAEIVIFTLGAKGVFGTKILLPCHLAVVIAMAFLLRRPLLSGVDGGVALLGLFATLAVGPFGAAGALLLPGMMRRSISSMARLNAWYERISLSSEQDALTRLSDRVAIGRAQNLAAPAPQSFDALFQTGAIAEQQTALGMIARAFHPDYLPALKNALDSPEPVIRVQAAAVAARVRGSLAMQTEQLLLRAADPLLSPAAAASAAAELEHAIASGLLDEAIRVRATGVRDGLLARTFARQDVRRNNHDAESTAYQMPPGQISPASQQAYEANLLARGRLAEFRAVRLSARQPVFGRYRRRLIAPRPVTQLLQQRLVRS